MKQNQNILPVILLMLVGAFARLIPHLPNFTPIESLTIFGAAYLSRKQWAVLMPVIILYASDFIINNTIARSFFPDQEGIIWFSTYMIYNTLAIILIVMLSSGILKTINIKNIIISVLGASIIFFLVTNFGSWMTELSIYPRDLSGLLASYLAGVPFFRTSLLSNLLFTILLFGSYHLFTNLVATRFSASKSR